MSCYLFKKLEEACGREILVLLPKHMTYIRVDRSQYSRDAVSAGLPGSGVFSDAKVDRQDRRLQFRRGAVGNHHRNVPHRLWKEHRSRGKLPAIQTRIQYRCGCAMQARVL